MTRRPTRSATLRIFPVLLSCAALLAGCSAEAPTAGVTGAAPGAGAAAPQDVTTMIGDTTVRATVLQTSMLGEMVANKYGIERSDNRIMLLVGLREGESAQATSVIAKVSATATDLRGQRETIELRQLVSGELVDYVGIVETTLPDTLTFNIEIKLDNGKRSRMKFNRQFTPH